METHYQNKDSKIYIAMSKPGKVWTKIKLEWMRQDMPVHDRHNRMCIHQMKNKVKTKILAESFCF